MAGGLKFFGPMSGIASLPLILGSAWYGVNRIKLESPTPDSLAIPQETDRTLKTSFPECVGLCYPQVRG